MYSLKRLGFSFYRTIVINMFDSSYYVGLLPKSVKIKSLSNNSTSSNSNYSESRSTYKEAIQALGSLISNPATIQKSIQNQINHIADIQKYLQRVDIGPDKLDELSIIHVSGTKGKGSTCALTESILRSFNIKTGFFSSPHLISVVERIRINGTPIDREKFTKYFWKIYNLLNEQKENENDMPGYFKFLTVLSFHVFIEEKVDVVILEVGIGGENDCTNVVRNTKTVGITSLGLEHTNLLGNTLKEIAWQKAGIIKPNSNVFTIPHPEECIEVIKGRITEKNAKLFIAPDFNDYKWTRIPNLQIDNEIQKQNASLAIQLAYDWLKVNKIQNLSCLKNKINLNGITLETCDEVIKGLENCFWPGRCQIITLRNKKFFLDGAHTKESMIICRDWFVKSTNNGNKKFLIFNTIGDRNAKDLLQTLNDCIRFDKAFFTTNTPFRHKTTDDINSNWYSHEQQMQRVQDCFEYWTSIYGEMSAFKCKDMLEALINLEKEINRIDDEQNVVNILVTGSLHLIGSTIIALEEFENEHNENSNKIH